jgi:hypothetical protein
MRGLSFAAFLPRLERRWRLERTAWRIQRGFERESGRVREAEVLSMCITASYRSISWAGKNCSSIARAPTKRERCWRVNQPEPASSVVASRRSKMKVGMPQERKYFAWQHARCVPKACSGCLSPPWTGLFALPAPPFAAPGERPAHFGSPNRQRGPRSASHTRQQTKRRTLVSSL